MSCKKFLMLILTLSFISILSAQSNFFAGINGDLVFSGDSSEKLNTGFGGGFTAEAGVNLGLVDLALKAGYSKSTGDDLIISMDETKFGAGIAFNIDSKLISSFPKFF